MTGPGRRVLLVDWLGRGGIAQTAESWRRTLQSGGHHVTVVSRAGRELATDWDVRASRGPAVLGRLLSHRAVVRAGIDAVRLHRPDVVVIQNYVVPLLELPLYEAAHDNGAHVLVVVHNHDPHSRASGSRQGLRRLVDTADCVVTHSEFVADRLHRAQGVHCVPHPLPLGLLAEDRPAILPRSRCPTVVQFGIMNRGYKNPHLVENLEAALPELRFVVAGVGARSRIGIAFDRFLNGGELAAIVEASDTSVLPYTQASQSGAVVLSQALGTVPVASAVGGIPEQIVHGVDGWLIPPGAGPAEWAADLRTLTGSGVLQSMAEAGRARVAYGHTLFRSAVNRLVEHGAT